MADNDRIEAIAGISGLSGKGGVRDVGSLGSGSQTQHDSSVKPIDTRDRVSFSEDIAEDYPGIEESKKAVPADQGFKPGMVAGPVFISGEDQRIRGVASSIQPAGVFKSPV